MRYKTIIINYNVGAFRGKQFIYSKTRTDKLYNLGAHLFSLFSLIPFGLATLFERIRNTRKPHKKASTSELIQKYNDEFKQLESLIVSQSSALKILEEKYRAKNKEFWKSSKGLEELEKIMIKPSIVWSLFYLEDELIRRKQLSTPQLTLHYNNTLF